MDTSTLNGKIMSGYQGWFTTPCDGSGRGWIHYARKNQGNVSSETSRFEIWPDTSEMDEDELCPTDFINSDGSRAGLPSPVNRKTVLRHFKWMADYGHDGVFLQRFHPYCADRDKFRHMDKVLENCREGAKQYQRAYGMMYDMSGMKGCDCGPMIDDWKRLLDETSLIEDEMYIHHKGKPVVTVWGLGFNDRLDYTWKDCMPLVEYLKDWGATLMLGIPTGWREQPQSHLYEQNNPEVSIIRYGDCFPDKEMHEAFAMADILSPWSIARVATVEAAGRLAREVWAADLEWCRERGIDYMPVVYPGFSWHNMKNDAPANQVPRQKGELLWKLYYEAVKLGSGMIYQAMFDEIDEGTAIFKCSNNPPGKPGQFLDMEGVPSDHYLKIVEAAIKMLRGEIPLQEKCPVEE